MQRVRRILHATDFSTASRPALSTAIALARRSRAHLTLVHTLPPPALVLEDSYISAKAFRELEERAFRQAEGRLRRLGARARTAGVRVSTLVLRGTPFEQIIRAAGRERADLIVIGTHGRTGFARLMLGSVAERVVGLARCPVLTVRSKE
jgi:nucleotide-binding universal stress UspA family protein